MQPMQLQGTPQMKMMFETLSLSLSSCWCVSCCPFSDGVPSFWLSASVHTVNQLPEVFLYSPSVSKEIAPSKSLFH
jgi:hypothetical protein